MVTSDGGVRVSCSRLVANAGIRRPRKGHPHHDHPSECLERGFRLGVFTKAVLSPVGQHRFVV